MLRIIQGLGFTYTLMLPLVVSWINQTGESSTCTQISCCSFFQCSGERLEKHNNKEDHENNVSSLKRNCRGAIEKDHHEQREEELYETYAKQIS